VNIKRRAPEFFAMVMVEIKFFNLP